VVKSKPSEKTSMKQAVKRAVLADSFMLVSFLVYD
jgi:hypothetical protein